MDQNKFKASIVTMDACDLAFPCFHIGDKWNGWTMPYFRFKHAKAVAKEFKGRYDKSTDTFIIDDNGEEDVFTAMIIKVNGKDVKVYGIGAGSWCWELADNMKLFEAYWGNDFYNEGTYLMTESLFSEQNSYEKEEVENIHALKIGEKWLSPDYGSAHTVKRVK